MISQAYCAEYCSANLANESSEYSPSKNIRQTEAMTCIVRMVPTMIRLQRQGIMSHVSGRITFP